MLSNRDAVANVAVRDLNVAAEFYRNTLGLEPTHQEGDEAITFQSGRSSINVYRSDYAGTNKATAVSGRSTTSRRRSRRSGTRGSGSSTTTCRA